MVLVEGFQAAEFVLGVHGKLAQCFAIPVDAPGLFAGGEPETAPGDACGCGQQEEQ